MSVQWRSRQLGVIGVFDSGVGGLTVVRELRRLLPHETILYLGDTARVPYGNKSKETIQQYAQEVLHFLQIASQELDQRLHQAHPHISSQTAALKLVVIACNTVSALALDYLRELTDIPIIGVIRPAVKNALSVASTQTIGVIGTEATVTSKAYPRTLQEIDPSKAVIAQPCPLFVPLVEENWIEHPATELIARTYLEHFDSWNTDTLILGCTHYPLLKPLLKKILPDVHLIDSATTTAQQVRAMLQKRGWQHPSQQKGDLLCFVTDAPERFAHLARRFLGEEPQSVEKVELSRFLEPTKVR